MKKILSLTIFILLCSVSVQAFAAPGTSASSVILYDADGGTVLYENSADTQMRIASTTKIMTALVVLENCAVDEEVEIKPEYTNVEGSSIYLKAGENLTIRELLYGLMLASGNDSAVALACYTSGSTEKFAELMNKKAAELGCRNTMFKNPHGLDTQGHFSSARDLAIITAEALKNQTFREIISTKDISIGTRSLRNHNKLLWSYDSMIGGKTGFTKASGRTLVTAASKGGMTLVCVTLSDPDDWLDHTNLFDWAFGEYQSIKVNKSDTAYVSLPVISGEKNVVSIRPSYDFSYLCSKTDTLTTTVEAPRFVYAGIIKGARAGRLILKKNGETITEIPLVYAESVRLDESVPLTSWEKIKQAWYLANSSIGQRYNPYNAY